MKTKWILSLLIGFVISIQAQNSVTSFTLINADTDQPIAAFDPLTDGATLNLTQLPTQKSECTR